MNDKEKIARSVRFVALFILTQGVMPSWGGDGSTLVEQGARKVPFDLGRTLYEEGRGADGREIHGRLGNGVELVGSAVACANCHGHDGRGLSEAGLRAPDIRWSKLTDPYAPARQGRKTVPYDRSSLTQALVAGRRPDGTALDPAMPRFDLTEAEVPALIEQLIALSAEAAPPPSRPAILGLVPQPGRDRTADQFVQIVEQCPETMRPQPVASVRWVHYRNPDDAIRRLEEIRSRETALLFVAPYLVGWEDRFAEQTALWAVTVLLPFGLWSPPGSEQWLYRLPMVERQVERLVEVAARQGAGGVTLAIDDRDALSEHLGAVAERMARTLGFPAERWMAHGQANPLHAERPLLWLRPMKGIERLVGRKVPHTVLLPSLFYQRSAVPKTGPWVKIDWVVAYPYPPRESSTGRWLAPAAVWGQAACAILASLASSEQADKFSRTLDLAPLPIVILPRPTDAAARAMVGILRDRPMASH